MTHKLFQTVSLDTSVYLGEELQTNFNFEAPIS